MKGKETLRIEQLLYDMSRIIGTYSCHEVGLFRGREIVDFMSINTKREIICYEIKVSLADYNSPSKLSFHGNKNYLVLSQELYEELVRRDLIKDVKKNVGILVARDTYLDCIKKCRVQPASFSVEKALFLLIKSIARERTKLQLEVLNLKKRLRK